MKINVYVNGAYAYTTARYKTCKEAITELKQQKVVEVASIPPYMISIQDSDKITAKRIKN